MEDQKEFRAEGRTFWAPRVQKFTYQTAGRISTWLNHHPKVIRTLPYLFAAWIVWTVAYVLAIMFITDPIADLIINSYNNLMNLAFLLVAIWAIAWFGEASIRWFKIKFRQ